jgi:hypothetical protein
MVDRRNNALLPRRARAGGAIAEPEHSNDRPEPRDRAPWATPQAAGCFAIVQGANQRAPHASPPLGPFGRHRSISLNSHRTP